MARYIGRHGESRVAKVALKTPVTAGSAGNPRDENLCGGSGQTALDIGPWHLRTLLTYTDIGI